MDEKHVLPTTGVAENLQFGRHYGEYKNTNPEIRQTKSSECFEICEIDRFQYEEYENNITDIRQPWVMGRVDLATVANDQIHVLPTTVVAEN